MARSHTSKFSDTFCHMSHEGKVYMALQSFTSSYSKKKVQPPVGLGRGMGSNVQLFKVQNGEYKGADEPQNPQNYVRPSKQALE